MVMMIMEICQDQHIFLKEMALYGHNNKNCWLQMVLHLIGLVGLLGYMKIMLWLAYYDDSERGSAYVFDITEDTLLIENRPNDGTTIVSICFRTKNGHRNQ